jgi:hypothetical protein
MLCPSCKGQLRQSNQSEDISIYYCYYCDANYHFVNNIFERIDVDVKLPELEIATRVYVDNKEHDFFLEHGIITQIAHIHYRVKMVSRNKEINGKQIWFPEHWIKALPKELLRHVKNEDLP